MPKLLALDLSSSTGYAVFSYDQIPQQNPILLAYGVVANTVSIKNSGVYPWGLMDAVESMWNKIEPLIVEHKPDIIVVEEVNIARARFVQKFLDGLHFRVLQGLRSQFENKVLFVSSSIWRRQLGAVLSKEDKKQNAQLSKAKSQAKRSKKKLDKKALGINKKLNKKDAALRFVNSEYGFSLRTKDDDIADAICEGLAIIRGAPVCDGK